MTDKPSPRRCRNTAYFLVEVFQKDGPISRTAAINGRASTNCVLLQLAWQESPIHLTLAKGCFGRFMCVCGWSLLVRWSSRQMVGHDSATGLVASMLLRWHALAPVPSTTSRHAPQMPPGYSSGLGHAAYSPAQSSEGAAGRSITRASTSRSRRSTLLQLTNILYYFTAQFHRPSMLYCPDQKGHSSKYAPAAQHSRPRQVLLTPPLRLQIVRHIRHGVYSLSSPEPPGGSLHMGESSTCSGGRSRIP